MEEKLKSDRDYTYSELGRLMEILEEMKPKRKGTL
jgi:hypothetical protein